MDKTGDLMPANDIAKQLGITVDLFRDLVSRGFLPQSLPISPRVKLWSSEDVACCLWMLKNIHRFKKMTADEAAKEELLDK